VLRRVGTEQDAAQDIAQVALTRGVQRLASYRAEASLFTWLCQIARHEIADHLARSARRGLATAVLLTREDDPAVRAALESIHALADEEPERHLQREDLRMLVHAALDYLPERYAQVLEMKYLDDLSVESIAGRLGVTGIAVQSLLARARAAFREASALLSDDFAALGVAAAGNLGGAKS
ncbi:MAG TPA: sigma-70 family RNA polymerase sigma factor, partial [Steroidobacteraceae bacterium]|nr:sigma-70 family RNA polymerase sigma factor [Steroidobacteraceae bacterium]